MADQFKKRLECIECYEQFDKALAAKQCCGSLPVTIFICEVCGRDHYSEADVRVCCFRIANPTPAARREIETRPLPRHLMEPDLGL